MHIPDGFIPPSLCIAGYALTGGVTWYCLRKINRTTNPSQQIPKASLLTAAFFVASLIHIPLPPSSLHLVLNGMMGTILGYYAFPAILIGLFFQAVMFQHGGLSTLGVNAAMMGIPALLAYHLFQLKNRINERKQLWTRVLAALAGAVSLGLSAFIFVVITITNISQDLNVQTEKNLILLSLIGYLVQALLEGIFTMMLIVFLDKVKPEILKG